MQRFNSLQFKASFVSVVLIVSVALILSFYSFKSFERSLINMMEERSQNLASWLARSSEYWLWIQDQEKLSSIIQLAANEKDIKYIIFYRADGGVLSSSLRDPAQVDFARGPEVLETTLPIFSQRESLEVEEGKSPLKSFIGRVRVGLSLRSVNQAIRRTGLIISAITLGIMFFGILLTLLLMRFILRPIKELKDTAYAISHGNLDLRAQVSGRDEIGDMAGSFNLMAEKLSGIVKETRGYLESLIEDSIDGIISFDFSLNTVSWNKGAEHIFGFTEKEAIGKTLPIFSNEYLMELSHLVSRVKKGERILPKETNCLKKDGTEIPVLYSASPIRDARGGVMGISAIIKDLSEIKKADKMKADLLSVISHELRTPIAIIQGNLSNVIDGLLGPIQDKTKETLQKIQQQAEHLIRLVNTVLDISRIGYGGKLEVEKNPFALSETTTNIISVYEPRFKAKQIELKLEIEKAIPAVMADQNQLDRLVANLIENAIKFTPEKGRIVIGVREFEGKIEFRISDSGVGIAPENIEKIFDKFFQVDLTHTRAAGGIGMGLTICREIVHAHAGRIWAESEGLGKGSTVIFQIPIA